MSTALESRYIVVFGAIGSGRTKFINSITGESLPEGHTHSQCTRSMQTAECDLDGQHIVFIDTPGFNEDDVVPFAKIKRELKRMKREGKQVVGAIYTHRVVDHRASDEALKKFQLFCEQFDDNGMADVAIVTTMWSHVGSREDAAMRHQNLCSHGLRTAIDGGATVSAYDGERESAEAIVRALLKRSSGRFSLSARPTN